MLIKIIRTGGTIESVETENGLTPKIVDFSFLENEKIELEYDFPFTKDSTDICANDILKIAEIIRNSDADGFVITHGTDTMAYSASALSFMIENLSKPVIFTGSQLPIGMPRTDGKENLISAVEIAAAKDAEGHALVPEVCICFDNILMRGNRTSKVNSDHFRAFRSENMPPLAEAGINIRYNTGIIRRPASWEAPPIFRKSLDTRVSILKMHPGITPQVVEHILCGNESRAVILETYGAGNAPSKQWFLDLIHKASEMGKIIVNVTQCLAGSVNMDIYATGKRLKDEGVCSGYDSTSEGALGKLFYLMGDSEDNETVKSRLEHILRGEISK